GLDHLAVAVVVEKLEQLLATQFLAALDDARDPRIIDSHGVLDTALAAKAEAQLRTVDRHVLAAQRGESVRLVFAGKLLRSDADQRSLEQPHDGREYFFTRQSGKRHVVFDALADLPDHVPEVEEAF